MLSHFQNSFSAVRTGWLKQCLNLFSFVSFISSMESVFIGLDSHAEGATKCSIIACDATGDIVCKE